MLYLILSSLLIFSSSLARAECKKYLIVYPTNYNFNNSKRILSAWEKENKSRLSGCDEIIPTKDARITLNEINLDFYTYYGILNLTKNQVDYIKKNTGANRIIKLVQSVAADDIALIPVIIDLTTQKQVFDSPFENVTFLRDEAGSLLDLSSFNAVISLLMTWILPNSFTLGVGYSYFPNTIDEDTTLGQEYLNEGESGRANLALYIESIYPPFSFNNLDWQFQAYGSMGFALQYNSQDSVENGDELVDYYNIFSMINPKLVLQVSFHTDIGSFFANVSPGWAGVYFNDNFENEMLKGALSLGVGFGYRYFVNKNLHLDWINNGTRFYPELVKNEYVLAEYQLVSILGLGYYVPDIYDSIFEWFAS